MLNLYEIVTYFKLLFAPVVFHTSTSSCQSQNFLKHRGSQHVHGGSHLGSPVLSQNWITLFCVFSLNDTKQNKLSAVDCVYNINAVLFRCRVIWCVFLCFGWSGETAEPQSCLQVNTYEHIQTNCDVQINTDT